MTLFGFHVTLLRFRVTLPVTLRDYAEQKRMGGRAAAGVKAVVQAVAVLVRAIVGGGDYPASPREPRRAASQRSVAPSASSSSASPSTAVSRARPGVTWPGRGLSE